MSSVGDDIYNDPVANPAPRRSGLTQHVEHEAPLGFQGKRFDARKYRHYDKLAGMSASPVQWHVTKDDRMDAVTAGEKLHEIHQMYGIAREQPEVIEAFNNSLFFCHTLNSGSVLQPGRSKLIVKNNEFDFAEVVRKLGVDLRRFFRAFADDVARVNSAVLEQYNPQDIESTEKHTWLMEVAADRGLIRHPHLAHDSSEKVSHLTPGERAAVAASKQGVFATIINAADRHTSNARMTTSDDYDSTNKITVQNTSGQK